MEVPQVHELVNAVVVAENVRYLLLKYTVNQ